MHPAIGDTAMVPADTREGAKGTWLHMPVLNKAIQELFDPYGRMNATLGVELPFTDSNIQTTVPSGLHRSGHREHQGRRDPDLEDHP